MARHPRLVMKPLTDRKAHWPTLRLGAGRALLVLGLAGFVIPLLPGTPFLLLGAWILGPDHPHVRDTVGRVEALWKARRRL